jgi:hypothetical protein
MDFAYAEMLSIMLITISVVTVALRFTAKHAWSTLIQDFLPPHSLT